MSDETPTRNSGITLVGELPWGSHFCQFYRTQKDMLDIVIPYFRAGLESDELCVWVTSEFLSSVEALTALEAAIPNFSDYRATQQIEIFEYTDWYLQGGTFDLKRTLTMWLDKLKEARARGYRGMRVSGCPHWIDSKKDWDDFSAYEAEINNAIGGTELLVLCTYSLDKCSVAEILDVIRHHEFAMAINRGEWQIIKMPTLVEPPGRHTHVA